jgi:hypothetical protein
VPFSRNVVFHIHHAAGTFATVLSTQLPISANHYGYLRAISFDLHRLFRYHGRRHSYLSAACAAPAGFPTATFPLARVSMSFEGGAILSATVTRSCRVRG